MAQIGQYDFPWIDDQQLAQLLGNARPKTLQDIEGDPGYWGQIFSQWIAYMDGSQAAGVQAVYNQWVQNPKGPARDQLKNFNGVDLRDKFHEDLGSAKAALRIWDRESGAGENRIDEALGGLID